MYLVREGPKSLPSSNRKTVAIVELLCLQNDIGRGEFRGYGEGLLILVVVTRPTMPNNSPQLRVYWAGGDSAKNLVIQLAC
jgi:hypothetical protein